MPLSYQVKPPVMAQEDHTDLTHAAAQHSAMTGQVSAHAAKVTLCIFTDIYAAAS